MKFSLFMWFYLFSALFCWQTSAEELASEAELYEGPEYVSAFKNPADDPALPNVLLIGDSISNAYTVDVRKQLKGKADVFRIPGNGKNSAYGLKKLDQWLAMAPGKWDVIHFNWGLWDLCYRNPESKTQGHRDKVNGTITAAPEQYRANMEQLVSRLKQTGAVLIWCTTTPVPEGEAGRRLGDDLVYNAAAEKIMKKNAVRINDLHAHALLRYPEIQKQPGDVHYTPEGSAYLAEKVALEISTALLSVCACSSFGTESIALDDGQSGLITEKLNAAQPNDAGVLLSRRLELPAFERGAYFGGGLGSKFVWPRLANQMTPWFVYDNDMTTLFAEPFAKNPCSTIGKGAQPQAMFALYQLTSGDYLTLLPLSKGSTMSWLNTSESGAVTVELGNFGTGVQSGTVPLLAWAKDPDMYRSLNKAWELVLDELDGSTDWRMNKIYPEAMKYLGWCSWEHFRKNISSGKLVEAAETIENSCLPIRWFLVDDGFQIEQKTALKSFAPNPKKFPDGWGPLLSMRKEEKIKWFGLWHSYMGLWNGIANENDFGELNDDLIPFGKNKGPGGSKEGTQRFYDAFIGSVAGYGFDFVKIDNQSLYNNKQQNVESSVQINSWMLEALENAVQEKLPQGMINCMSQGTPQVLGTRRSAVSRVSIDYKLNDLAKAKAHIEQSYVCTLFQGQTVWPDHDMFHSSDPDCGELMAISKAMSGAPIYLSDNPSDFCAPFIRPLAYADGELLRPLAPGAPLPDSVMMDVYKSGKAFRVIAPLANGCAAVVPYNLSHPSRPVTAEVTAADYTHASGMMQPYPGPWELPEEGLVCFDWRNGTGRKLDAPYAVELEGFSDRLLLLAPVQNGWAVIGARGKYLSPAAVKSVDAAADRLSVEMVESGPLVIWCAEGTPKAKGTTAQDLGNGFWQFDSRGCEISITR